MYYYYRCLAIDRDDVVRDGGDIGADREINRDDVIETDASPTSGGSEHNLIL